jgi:hypothetical protein
MKNRHKNRRQRRILLHLGQEVKLNNLNSSYRNIELILLEFYRFWARIEMKLRESLKLWRRRYAILDLKLETRRLSD